MSVLVERRCELFILCPSSEEEQERVQGAGCMVLLWFVQLCLCVYEKG